MPDWLARQLEICAKYGASFAPSSDEDKAGVASNTDLRPLNGLRHPPEPGTCGWFIWGGSVLSDSPEYFKPYHVAHLQELCPQVLPFLGLSPGWRFLIHGEHVDVWFDDSLLTPAP